MTRNLPHLVNFDGISRLNYEASCYESGLILAGAEGSLELGFIFLGQ